MLNLDDAYINFLKTRGIWSTNGVRVIATKLPPGDDFVLAVVIEPHTSITDIKNVWSVHIAKFRDLLYRDRVSPEASFHKNLLAMKSQMVYDKKLRPMSYGDIAEGYNHAIENHLRAYLNYDKNNNPYAESLKQFFGDLAKAKTAIIELLEEDKQDYLTVAKHLLVYFCKEATANELLEKTLDQIKLGEYPPKWKRPKKRLAPITATMVREAIRTYKSKTKRKTLRPKLSMGKPG